MKECSARAVQLYELVLANGRSASPYVWRSRHALARIHGRSRAAAACDAQRVRAVECASGEFPVSWRLAPPNYADYLVLAVRVSTLPLLAADDEILRAWFTRSLDPYVGLGRDARMRPLFE